MDSEEQSNSDNVIFSQESPYSTLTASLMENERNVYLYLHPTHNPQLEVKAIWIRNLKPALDETDSASMKLGFAPLIKKDACDHPLGASPFSKEDRFEILWFQEGNALVLYRNNEIEAILPPWSGQDGFSGHARSIIGEGDIGMYPLPPKDSPLYDRIQENVTFWEKRNQDKDWDNFRDDMLARYESVYGTHRKYYMVTERKYPLIGIAEFAKDNEIIYATIGMSRQNMPGAEFALNDPDAHCRIEIITKYKHEEEWVPGLLGRMALYPWLINSWLGHGHTYESGLTMPLADYLLTSDYQEDVLIKPETLLLDGKYKREYLFAVPVYQEELLVARMKGGEFAVKKVMKRLQKN